MAIWEDVCVGQWGVHQKQLYFNYFLSFRKTKVIKILLINWNIKI